MQLPEWRDVNTRRTLLQSVAAVASLMLLATGCGNRIPDPEVASSRPAGGSAAGYSPDSGVPAGDAGSATAGSPVTGSAPGMAGEAGTTSGTTMAAPFPGDSSPRAGAAAQGAGAPKPESAAQARSRPSNPIRSEATAAPAAPPSPGSPPVGSAPPRGVCTTALPPVVIGSVSTLSGFAGEAVGAGPKAVQAWAAAVNASGGLQCHPVKYIVADDSGDPSRHQTLLQQLVEQDKVIAFVHNAAPLSGYSSVNYINSKRVPVIGNEGGSSWFYDSPYFFPQGLTGGNELPETYFAALASARRTGDRLKLAVLSCVEAPDCTRVDNVADAMAKKYGLDLVYKAKATLTQPDYTSHCLRAQQEGAEALLTAMEGNSIHRIARSCSGVGFKPIYVYGPAVRRDFAGNPDLEGFIGTVFTRTWFDTTNPVIAEMHSALSKYAPGLAPDVMTASGWTSAKVFELAAKQLPEKPSSDAILRGLWSIKDDDLGGITSPLTYVEGQPSKRLGCFWTPTVKGGRWTGGDTRMCLK